jgi:hypothetical protein
VEDSPPISEMSLSFRVIVAGADRSRDMEPALRAAADRRPDRGLARRIEDEQPVLALGSARSESEYLSRHLSLLRARNRIDTLLFETPAGPGLGGRLLHRLRLAVWRTLRYAFDWLAFRQNSINLRLTSQLEMEKEERERQVAALERRIRALEERGSGEGGQR